MEEKVSGTGYVQSEVNQLESWELQYYALNFDNTEEELKAVINSHAPYKSSLQK